ncbi:hypothetical protein [Tellurirhabdus rosea]|uniref:hypothetical protein n=1 Tax=Tellurirhabdus rosea TaxID=2674997 RepID=UPI0022531BC3|nr:hypothetical protein [Tellurirhabdus rosea]
MRKAIGIGIAAGLLLLGNTSNAQETKGLQIVLPQQAGWTTVSEGRTIDVHLKAVGAKTDSLSYSIAEGRVEGMNLDSTGHFVWTPSYDLAERPNTTKTIGILFEVRNTQGDRATQQVEFKVQHVNRPPIVGELRPFYVRYKTLNTYKMDPALVKDEDGDPLVFIPITDQMPEGSKLSAQGELTWQLSLNQFNKLKSQPLYIEFWVEDQPAKARTKGRLKVEVTSMDLPPEISLIPKDTRIRIKENGTVNLKFYLTDPNGDDDISAFDLVSEDQRVPKSALVKNTQNQYEFIWTPGYDFVKDPLDTLSFQMVFFALDKAQNREEKRLTFTIQNTINDMERDRYLYGQYRQAIVSAWNLLTQLQEKEEELKKSYRKAKKGKRNRSMVNASLGAVTGVAPTIAANNKNTNVQTNLRYVSAVGGTAVMTMGTLEATEVIGKSMKDLLDRFNYVMNKKSEIQNKGDFFAREFALRSARRDREFIRKLDEFKQSLSLSGLVALELDAGWENKKEATDKAIKRTFKDFAPLEETQ